MRKLFNVLLVLNFLVEAMAAASLIGGPDGLAAAGRGGMWSMHYGFAALAIASVSLWIWPYRSDRKAVTAVLGLLLTFHSGLVVSLAAAGDQAVGLVLHAVLASLSALLFARRGRLTAP